MTGSEAQQMLNTAAEALADWYRQGGNPGTERYKWLMNELALAVDIYHQRIPTR